MSKPNEIKGKIGGIYSFKVKRADGTIDDYGHQRNLITSIGIDRLFTSTDAGASYTQVGTFARAGTGSTAASTSDTALQTQTVSTNTYDTVAGACGSTDNTTEGSTTHKRTYIFAAATGSSTIREVGVGWTASTASTLFSRVVLNTPISLNTGDVLIVVYNLKIIFDQLINATSVNLTTGTFALVGSFKMVNQFLFVFGAISSNGNADGQAATEASRVITGFNGSSQLQIVFGTNTTFPTVNTTGSITGSSVPAMGTRAVAHTNGTTTFVGTVKTTSVTAVTGIRTIAVRWGATSTLYPFWIITDNAQTKELNKVIGFTYTTTFTRI